jgi:hypothetical protein
MLNFPAGTSQFAVYPNPARGSINLYSSEDDGTYSLISIAGQTLFTGELTKGNQVIDLSSYPSDLYLLRIQTNGHTVIKKISLQN